MKTICLISFTFIFLISCNNSNYKVLNEKTITKEEFGDKWPFTVNQGKLKCVQYYAEGVNSELIQGVVFEANGKEYGINGTAKSWGVNLGYEDVDNIWAVDLKMKEKLMRMGSSEKDATTKIDIGIIIEEGLKLCN